MLIGGEGGLMEGGEVCGGGVGGVEGVLLEGGLKGYVREHEQGMM